ncbi:helix-turn-helix transcriptional regulator [Halorientalis litorea]|uniref:helix-turn-helix transcriptional regulator n=1 Tax=Halorientalis litorea TaxID=2931977 RepID=UPI001FF2BF19|nr:helix-turn-helix domain-containing protein [Halorientalis litorea]
MVRSLPVVVLCVLLVGTAVLSGVLAVPTGRTDGAVAAQSDRTSAFVQPDQFSSATFTVEVHENGSARWTFSYYTSALNASQQDDFREYARRFESRETDLWTNFQNRADALVSAGTNATGRNMTARNFRHAASLNDVGNRGVVTMSFLWADFAQVQGDRVVVADVFDGVFYIGPSQWLVFERGPGLRFDSTSPDPDAVSGGTLAESDTVTYYGEQQFPDNNPRVAFATDTAGAAEDGGGEAATTTGGPESAGGIPMTLLGFAVLVVGLGAVVAWRTDVFRSGDEGSVTAAPDDGSDAGAVATATSDATTEAEPAVPDEELLTDEDRVVKLLEESGGRMKQANIVEETEWSKSKVSMLLSDMEEEGDISKLRVGRENIVSLSGHEPDAAGSPFDDED